MFRKPVAAAIVAAALFTSWLAVTSGTVSGGAIAHAQQPPRCADLNGDGRVGFADALAELHALRQRLIDARYDINRDGSVTWLDLAALVRQIGRRCRDVPAPTPPPPTATPRPPATTTPTATATATTTATATPTAATDSTPTPTDTPWVDLDRRRRGGPSGPPPGSHRVCAWATGVAA